MTNISPLNSLVMGFSMIFFCVGLGMLFLRKSAAGEVGLGFWAASFFLNSAGFLLLTVNDTSNPWQFFTNGEALQMLGFISLTIGTYRFTGNEYKPWNLYALGGMTIAWAGTMVLMKHSLDGGYLFLQVLRASLFIWAGSMILKHVSKKLTVGRRLAGWGLLTWGVFTLSFPLVWQFQAMIPLAFGFLAGLHMLAAMGMVTLVVDRIRIRAEAVENHAQRLEGLLPICAYCKKIRDDHNNWQSIETYIRDRSGAEFSHGICRDCAKIHHPDIDLYSNGK